MAKRGKERRRAKHAHGTPATPAAPGGPAAGLVIAALLLTAAAYAPAFDNTFVYWDDHLYVLESELVQPAESDLTDVFAHTTLNNYHPLTILTWRWNAVDCADCMFRYSARSFIVGNVLLHLANTLLVFFLTFRWAGRRVFVGLFCAAVFGLHPMHVESVAWISQRKDVLHVFFVLSGLLCYDRFLDGRYAELRRPGRTWLAASLGLFVLACLSKATAVVFPLLMLLLDFWRNPTDSAPAALRETFAPRKLAATAPFFAVALLFGWMSLDLQGGGDFYGWIARPASDTTGSAINTFDVFTLLQRIQFASYGFCIYLVKLVAPAGLSPWHPYPAVQEYARGASFRFAPIAVIGILCGAIWSLRRGKLLAFGVGFYFLALAPVLQFVSVGVALIAERYTYLAYIGPAFVAGTALSQWAEQRSIRNRRVSIYALTAVISILWLVQTRRQVDVWQDSVTLWTRVIERYPEPSWPYETRADYYAVMADYWAQPGGNAELALDFARKAEADRAVVRRKQVRNE
jgi:hypothetical protein